MRTTHSLAGVVFVSRDTTSCTVIGRSNKAKEAVFPTCLQETKRRKRRHGVAACHACDHRTCTMQQEDGKHREIEVPVARFGSVIRTRCSRWWSRSAVCFPSLNVLHHPDSACMVTGPCAQFKCLKRPPGRPATRNAGRNRHLSPNPGSVQAHLICLLPFESTSPEASLASTPRARPPSCTRLLAHRHPSWQIRLDRAHQTGVDPWLTRST